MFEGNVTRALKFVGKLWWHNSIDNLKGSRPFFGVCCRCRLLLIILWFLFLCSGNNVNNAVREVCVAECRRLV